MAKSVKFENEYTKCQSLKNVLISILSYSYIGKSAAKEKPEKPEKKKRMKKPKDAPRKPMSAFFWY